MNRKDLTPEEERIIVHGGTEPPFSGRFVNEFSDGTYSCRRCGNELYRSTDKFRSSCGWPGFDAEVEGSVEYLQDIDGVRTEIRCADCGAHLGHVFNGEGITPRSVRHCVNSLSLKFQPRGSSERIEVAVFAAGCFWGVEYHMKRVPGVLSTRAGYTGGDEPDPAYEDLHTGTSDHAEAVEVTFDPSVLSYEDLAKVFFEIHDPVQVDRQGPDIGREYRSAIFYHSEEQKHTAEKLISFLRDTGLDVATELTKAGKFWEAENHHQNYMERRGSFPICHVRRKLFSSSSGL
jgi:peptide methionine sulfoxide reductase msrA/msrB